MVHEENRQNLKNSAPKLQRHVSHLMLCNKSPQTQRLQIIISSFHWSLIWQTYGDGFSFYSTVTGTKLGDSKSRPGNIWELICSRLIIDADVPLRGQLGLSARITHKGSSDSRGKSSRRRRIVRNCIAPSGPASGVMQHHRYIILAKLATEAHPGLRGGNTAHTSQWRRVNVTLEQSIQMVCIIHMSVLSKGGYTHTHTYKLGRKHTKILMTVTSRDWAGRVSFTFYFKHNFNLFFKHCF